MKKRITSFLRILFCSSSYLSTAQMKFHAPDNKLLNLTTNYKLKTANLSTGVQLQYAEQGNADGYPVIFLHGYTDSWHSFEKVLMHLSLSVHAYVLSQRGHGNSDKPWEGYAPSGFAADVVAFMQNLKIGSAVIVGYSMGATIAQHFVLDHPELAKA